MCRRLILFACCITSTFSYAQNVGIGTTTPGSGLELRGPNLSSQQRITDAVSGNSLVLQGGAGENLKVTGFNYSTGTARPLYLSVDGASTIMNPNGGNVGIGTTTPTGGYLLDVRGPVIAYNNISTHLVVQTTGGVNAWARYYLRTPAQSWYMGSSHNFVNNFFYIADETNNNTVRFGIHPGTGPIYMQGNTTQDLGGYGQPKAMVFLNANGTINRCYNGITGATTSGCGFTTVHIGTGHYQINFPFSLTTRFVAVTPQQGCCAGLMTASYNIFNQALDIGVVFKDAFINDYRAFATDAPVMVIVY